MTDDAEMLARWRLILGKYAQDSLCADGGGLSGNDARIDTALEFLYGREYAARGFDPRGQSPELGPGGSGAPMPSVPEWITMVQELFPHQARERLEADALDRYELTQMLADHRVLEKLEPSTELLTTLLSFKSHLSTESLAVLRRIVEQVVDDILKRIKREVELAITGRRNRFSRSHLKRMQNFDWQDTLRANLKHWDVERQRIIADRLLFNARLKRQFPWRVVLCIDQSGSMASSMIHAAVMAGILHGLPSVSVSMVLFSTEVVDVSEHVQDPVELLMSCFLGGGTDIGKAVAYCNQSLMHDPHHTIFALVTDFCEGGPMGVLQAEVATMVESGVTCLGLGGLLDGAGEPFYDKRIAAQLAELGMQIGAFTPKEFGQWLGDVIS